MAVDVVWIFSLPRSGSSVTAYAAAKPFGAVVADEVFGPWDRTGEPYNYPALQTQLVEAYHGSRCVLTPEVVGIATELFELLGEVHDERGAPYAMTLSLAPVARESGRT